MTGIATAMLDSIPMVCITGQVASQFIGSDAFQETDITGVTLPITKHNYLVTRAEDIAPMLRQAFYVARSGRPGPVLVDITKDAQQASTPFVWDGSPVRLPGYRPEHRPSEQDVRRAADLIDGAERPIVFCGHGIIASGASALLLDFVEKTGMPVASTLLGLGGFPATHPLCLGMMGMHGEAWVNRRDPGVRPHPRARDALRRPRHRQARDVREARQEDPLRARPRRDQQERPRRRAPHRRRGRDAAHADARRGPARPQRPRSGSQTITALKGDSAVRDIQTMPNTPGHLYAAHVMHDLWRITEGKALVVTDVGQHQMWEAQYYKHDFPRKLITSGGLGTMGFALPAAIGAKFARPDEEVWVIVGDGGFQMTAAELSTCAQEGIKVHVAVINNGYLGMVRQWQQFFYGGRYAATPLREPDFVKLAEAHGLLGLRVTERAQIEGVVAAGRAPQRARSSSISASSRKTASTRWCRQGPTSTT